MKSIFTPQIPQNIFIQQKETISFPRSRGDVRQDKSAAIRGRVASVQPERPVAVLRARQVESQPPRTQNTTTPQRKTVPLTLWVKPFIKAEVQRLVGLEQHQGKEDVSLSSVGGAFLERGLQQNVDMTYGALLGPIIENAIDRRMRARDNRLVALLVRIAFETGQIGPTTRFVNSCSRADQTMNLRRLSVAERLDAGGEVTLRRSAPACPRCSHR